MEGLASIALAVEHLERAGGGEEPGSIRTAGASLVSGSVIPTMPLPPSTDFTSAARVVSLDSIAPPPPSATEEEDPVAPLPSPQQPNNQALLSTTLERAEPPLQAASGELARLVQTLERVASVQRSSIPAPPPPDAVIGKVLESDVLCGRGGETNHHHGNIQYRYLVKICQPTYIASTRGEKPKIAEKIVLAVRMLGGRFLKKDTESNAWRDVGNKKAREKTSQALREGAPEMRNGLPPKQKNAKKNGATPAKRGSVSTVESSLSCSSFDGSSPTGLHPGLSVLFPKVVNTALAESLPPSPKKKQRTSLLMDALTASSPPAAPASPGSSSSHSSTDFASSVVTEEDLANTGCFSATISADDEDDSSKQHDPVVERAGPHKPTTTSRGPRLKLLKKRLQSDESTY